MVRGVVLCVKVIVCVWGCACYTNIIYKHLVNHTADLMDVASDEDEDYDPEQEEEDWKKVFIIY